MTPEKFLKLKKFQELGIPKREVARLTGWTWPTVNHTFESSSFEEYKQLVNTSLMKASADIKGKDNLKEFDRQLLLEISSILKDIREILRSRLAG